MQGITDTKNDLGTIKNHTKSLRIIDFTRFGASTFRDFETIRHASPETMQRITLPPFDFKTNPVEGDFEMLEMLKHCFYYLRKQVELLDDRKKDNFKVLLFLLVLLVSLKRCAKLYRIAIRTTQLLLLNHIGLQAVKKISKELKSKL